jgi:hypothetical protein
MSHFTAVPNVVLDMLLADPDFTGSELRVLLFVIRETVGWGQGFTTTSYSEIRDRCGIGSQSTVSKAIRALESRGLILFTPSSGGTQSTVGLNPDWDPDEASTESGPVQLVYQAPAVLSTESVQPSINKKKVLKKHGNSDSVRTEMPMPKTGLVADAENEPGTQDLADEFTNLTGCMPNAGVWSTKWEPPLALILERAGDYDTAVERMRLAVAWLRENKYTIASPQSIVNAVARVEQEGATKKGVNLTR